MGRKYIPTKSTFMKRLGEGIKGGIAGGLPSAIFTLLTGSSFLGSVIGSTIGSAFVDETTGRIIVVNGWMDAVESLLVLGR